MSTIRTIYKVLSLYSLFKIMFGKKGNKGKRLGKSLVRRQAHKGLAKLLR